MRGPAVAWKSQFAGPPPHLKEGSSKHQPGSIVIAWLELGSMYSFWKSIVLVLMILGWGGEAQAVPVDLLKTTVSVMCPVY